MTQKIVIHGDELSVAKKRAKALFAKKKAFAQKISQKKVLIQKLDESSLVSSQYL